LTKAVAAEDATYYAEPSDWDLPTREVLGGALLLSDDAAGAEKVFRAELEKHPRNGRALFGLTQSLRKQGKESAAKLVEVEFDRAWQKADTKLTVESLVGMTNTTETRAAVARTSDVQFSDVIVKTGVRIHYAYKGDPAGTPVIMLHGYTDSWFSFSNVLPLLDNKYRVYILDQRGHGDSSCPVGGYAMDQFASDVLAFMDAMNLKQATIVGHSIGSFVAQHVAALAPERVTKLVLVASATTVRNHTVLELQREIDKLADHVPESFVRGFQLSTAYQPLPQEFLQGVVKQSLKTPARVWREVMAEMVSPDANVELKKIKTPTLILWGDKETIFPRSEQELLVSALKNSTLKVYADTGHAPHWERPEWFARDLQDFIN